MTSHSASRRSIAVVGIIYLEFDSHSLGQRFVEVQRPGETSSNSVFSVSSIGESGALITRSSSGIVDP